MAFGESFGAFVGGFGRRERGEGPEQLILRLCPPIVPVPGW